jgi:hypothetical protein
MPAAKLCAAGVVLAAALIAMAAKPVDFAPDLPPRR